MDGVGPGFRRPTPSGRVTYIRSLIPARTSHQFTG
jgi:hypothetical protein